MQVSTRQSGGQVVLTITADNHSDRTVLSLFDRMNNKTVLRRIVCSTTYETTYHATTELHFSGLDERPPPSLFAHVFNRFRKWIGLRQ